MGLRSKTEPGKLLAQVCSSGSSVREIKGVAWMRAKSKEASGQFPAVIEALAPDSLKLEVTRPFGGTLAMLTVKGGSYKIDVPGRPENNRQGQDSWGGIPLKWATDLFLGKIPCPSTESLSRASVSISDEDELLVESKAAGREAAQKFVYRFEEEKGTYWPKMLHWESGSAVVDFEFDDPENGTRSPLRWEARSKQGEVKIRWRDREVTHHRGSS